MEYLLNLICFIVASTSFIYLIQKNSYFKVIGTIYLGIILIGMLSNWLKSN